MKPAMILSLITFVNYFAFSMGFVAKEADESISRTAASEATAGDREFAAFALVAFSILFPSIIFGAAWLLLTWLFSSTGGA